MADTALVPAGRVRLLNAAPPPTPTPGPVIYWMFRDQRSRDNWALLHAADLASRSSAPLAVAFNLFPRFLGAHARQLCFLLRALRQLPPRLAALNVPFFLLRGDAAHTLPALLARLSASALVTDFSPLRPIRAIKSQICDAVQIPFHEVDAHNVVPLWTASSKLEYSARTLRAKINRLLPEYLVEFPDFPPVAPWTGEPPPEVDWDGIIAQVVREAGDVPEIGWCEPGEEAAMAVLKGSEEGFLTRRLRSYGTDRNDPIKPKGLSGLSPYLHFGQISAQRCALEARRFRQTNPQSVDAFLEELIVRRELADNFCYYQPQYDSLQGAWDWARKTLADHAADKREHIYSKEQLEKAVTHDPLWNASQLEMVHHGKMHGFMRMYWAKKILEWTSGPEEALSVAIYLNDKYEIDGRDPSGYVGCMWSICGVHDQGWRERPVFGKIRYMNYAGCKRKFNVDLYIAYVNRLVSETKKRKPDNTVVLVGKLASEIKKREPDNTVVPAGKLASETKKREPDNTVVPVGKLASEIKKREPDNTVVPVRKLASETKKREPDNTVVPVGKLASEIKKRKPDNTVVPVGKLASEIKKRKPDNTVAAVGKLVSETQKRKPDNTVVPVGKDKGLSVKTE